jgi:hypothetical protein
MNSQLKVSVCLDVKLRIQKNVNFKHQAPAEFSVISVTFASLTRLLSHLLFTLKYLRVL